MLSDSARDDGSITLLVIGYTAILLVLVVAAIDVSKVFLAQRSLASAADAAALAAAEGVDRQRLYAGAALGCGDRLPLDPVRSADLATDSVQDDVPDLHHVGAIAPPVTTVTSTTVTVRLSGSVGVPFGKVLSWLDPSRPDGRVHVTETAHAQSPVTGPAGC